MGTKETRQHKETPANDQLRMPKQKKAMPRIKRHHVFLIIGLPITTVVSIILSLGWGVQSFCLACMIALGELPPITVALHSDTGHEMAHTYAHAEKWTPWLRERGVNVVRLKPPRTEVVKKEWGTGSIMIPAFTSDKDKPGEGVVPGQCTRIWKITPMRQYIRTLLPPGNPGAGAMASWQGISLDEIKRMRSSDVKYITNVYPLVGLRMKRGDSIKWLTERGLDVPPQVLMHVLPVPYP